MHQEVRQSTINTLFARLLLGHGATLSTPHFGSSFRFLRVFLFVLSLLFSLLWEDEQPSMRLGLCFIDQLNNSLALNEFWIETKLSSLVILTPAPPPPGMNGMKEAPTMNCTKWDRGACKLIPHFFGAFQLVVVGFFADST